jgi:hypothetical protein
LKDGLARAHFSLCFCVCHWLTIYIFNLISFFKENDFVQEIWFLSA